MDENILDSELSTKPSAYRFKAIALEIVPLILILVYSVINQTTIIIWLTPSIMGLVYLLFGWYLFKGIKISTGQVLTTILVGLYVTFVGLTYLFYIQSWEGSKEMSIVGSTIGVFIMISLLIRYLRNQKDELEYRYSLKLLSRVLIYQLCLVYFLIKGW